MNSQTNFLSSILVTSGNTTLLAAGSSLSDLALGQIGIFDADTNLAIDGTATVKNFYLAEAIDTDGDGIKDNYLMSAGQNIQGSGLEVVNKKAYTAGVPMIFTLTNYSAMPYQDYALKIELRDSEIMRTQGPVQFADTYVATATYTHPDTIPVGDANEITISLVSQINADVNQKYTAVATARSAITAATEGTSVDYAAGAEMTLADVKLLFAYNKTVVAASRIFTDIKITMKSVTKYPYSDVNLKYHKLRQTLAIPSVSEGFESNCTITTTQAMVYEQGSGYDIQALEYEAGGFTGNPGIYRTYSVVDVSRPINYLAVKTGTYDLYSLKYRFKSQAATTEYQSNLVTYIAVPSGDTTTGTALKTALNLIATQYDVTTIS